MSDDHFAPAQPPGDKDPWGGLSGKYASLLVNAAQLDAHNTKRQDFAYRIADSFWWRVRCVFQPHWLTQATYIGGDEARMIRDLYAAWPEEQCRLAEAESQRRCAEHEEGNLPTSGPAGVNYEAAPMSKRHAELIINAMQLVQSNEHRREAALKDGVDPVYLFVGGDEGHIIKDAYAALKRESDALKRI